MTAPLSMTHSLPAYGWQSAFALMAISVGLAVTVTKRDRHRAQGCFPMTD